ncbi:MAG TPA: hypothetical protein PKH07_20930, partial [bacterium]|nr:hypothetical protein [bacterium]
MFSQATTQYRGFDGISVVHLSILLSLSFLFTYPCCIQAAVVFNGLEISEQGFREIPLESDTLQQRPSDAVQDTFQRPGTGTSVGSVSSSSLKERRFVVESGLSAQELMAT